jgi:cardiolipin synthase
MAVKKVPVLNLPNVLSFARLLATPLIAWLIATDRMEAAFYVFVIAGITDALDGYLARRMQLQTDMGRIIDPLADKALLAMTYVMLGYVGYLPWWIIAFVVGRDALIVLAYGISGMFGVRIKPQPVFMSKVNTALQIILAASVLLVHGYSLDAQGLITVLLYSTAATTIFSWLQYLALWLMTRGTMETQQADQQANKDANGQS